MATAGVKLDLAREKSVLIGCFGGENIEFKYGSGTKCLEVKQFLHDKGYFPPSEQSLSSGGVHIFGDDELLDECLEGSGLMDMRPTEACRAKYLAILKPLKGQGFEVFKDALTELVASSSSETFRITFDYTNLKEEQFSGVCDVKPDDLIIDTVVQRIRDAIPAEYHISGLEVKIIGAFSDDSETGHPIYVSKFGDELKKSKVTFASIKDQLQGHDVVMLDVTIGLLYADLTSDDEPDLAVEEVDLFEALNIDTEDCAVERYMKSFEDIADETYQVVKVYRHSWEDPVFEVAFPRKNLRGCDLMAYVLNKIIKACMDLGLKMPDANDFRLTPKNSTKPIKPLDVIPETLTGVYLNVKLKGGVKGRDVVKNHIKKRAQSMQMSPDTFAQASQIVSRMSQTQEIEIDAFLKSMDLTDLKELSLSLEGSAPNSVKFSSVATFHPEMATIEGLIENLTHLKKQMTDKIADVAKKTCQVEGGNHKIDILKKKVAIVMAVKEAQSAPAVAPADVRMG